MSSTMTLPTFSEQLLAAICDVLADTSDGLTGKEIGDLLATCCIEDPLALPPGRYLSRPLGSSKRDRLRWALTERQKQDRCGNNVAAFIHAAMAPVRYIQEKDAFDARRDRLNQALSFAGLSVGEDGKLRRVSEARTLSEAQRRAGRLRRLLENRAVHSDVLAACRVELLQDENYFHAVLEAAKSVAEKLRKRGGASGDGAALVDDVLSAGKSRRPRLALNTLRTDSELSEQTGVATLIKGMFSTFRNPTAHAPKATFNVSEADALDLLTLASYLHRRLDAAVPTQPGVVQ